MVMNKKIILSMGLVAVIVVGIIIYGSLNVADPTADEAAMSKEKTTDMMSEEIEDESMAAGENATTEMMNAKIGRASCREKV